MTAGAIYEAAASAIRARFRDEVATPEDLAVVYDNQDSAAKTTRWARVSIDFGTAAQASTGGTSSMRFRVTGRVTVQLFEPIGTAKTKGDGQQLALIDAVDAAFRGVRIATPQIVFGAPSPLGAPDIDSDIWWRRRVEIPFRCDFFGIEQ